MGRVETKRTIAGAAAALPAWRARTARERAQVLRRWAELMLTHQGALGWLMTLEQGKPLADGQRRDAYAAAFLEWLGVILDATVANAGVMGRCTRERHDVELQFQVDHQGHFALTNGLLGASQDGRSRIVSTVSRS